jgi:hypothetical protein
MLLGHNGRVKVHSFRQSLDFKLTKTSLFPVSIFRKTLTRFLTVSVSFHCLRSFIIPPYGNQVHEIHPLQFPEYYGKGNTSLLAGMMRGRDYQMNREKGDRMEKESYRGYVMVLCGCIPCVLDAP